MFDYCIISMNGHEPFLVCTEVCNKTSAYLSSLYFVKCTFVQ